MEMMTGKNQIAALCSTIFASMRRMRIPAVVAVTALLCGSVPAMATGLIGLDIDTGNIYSVNKTTAALTLLASNVLPNGSCLALAPNDQLYSITTGTAPELYRINPNTFAAALVGPLGLSFVFEGGLALSPSGIAYATNADSAAVPELFTVNLNTGAASVVGTMTGAPHDINGLLWRSDGTLVGIDEDTNSLVTIDPTTAAVTTVAALGTKLGDVGDLTSVDGTAYFSTGVGPSGSDELWTVNLFTGADSLVGSFGTTVSGDGISGLAPASLPEPASIGFIGTIAAALLGRRRRSALFMS